MSKNSITRFSSTLLFIVTSLTLSLSYGGGHASQTNSTPKVLVLKFHADWCGSCRAMGPVLRDLQNKMDGKPILFSTLDRTNQSTSHQAQMLASALGIQKTYATTPGTGFLLVLDANSKEVLARLTKKQSVKEMSKVIQEFL